jgi:hypothetical protein
MLLHMLAGLGDESMAQSRQAGMGMFDSCLNKGHKQALDQTAYRFAEVGNQDTERITLQRH